MDDESNYILHFELVELLFMGILYLDMANQLQGLRRLAQGSNKQQPFPELLSFFLS